ncbi:MAG: hypothetical protein J5J00_01590 [Deltaproteobacteria bacterium]|nr:hypothetical protein [Deltaproteobacteria bacterium]
MADLTSKRSPTQLVISFEASTLPAADERGSQLRESACRDLISRGDSRAELSEKRLAMDEMWLDAFISPERLSDALRELGLPTLKSDVETTRHSFDRWFSHYHIDGKDVSLISSLLKAVSAVPEECISDYRQSGPLKAVQLSEAGRRILIALDFIGSDAVFDARRSADLGNWRVKSGEETWNWLAPRAMDKIALVQRCVAIIDRMVELGICTTENRDKDMLHFSAMVETSNKSPEGRHEEPSFPLRKAR